MPRLVVKTLEESVLGRCKAPGCGVPMISEWRWRQTTPARREGYSMHRGLGYCGAHYNRLKRNGHLGYVGAKTTEITDVDKVPLYECGCGVTMCSGQFRKRWPELKARGVVAMAKTTACYRCYHAAVAAGEYERRTRTAEEVLEEWDWLRDGGTDIHRAAERMGMTWKALDQALYRARRKGDPRGQLHPADVRRAA